MKILIIFHIQKMIFSNSFFIFILFFLFFLPSFLPAMASLNLEPGTFINSEGVQEKHKPEWRINFENWMVNEGPKVHFTFHSRMTSLFIFFHLLFIFLLSSFFLSSFIFHLSFPFICLFFLFFFPFLFHSVQRFFSWSPGLQWTVFCSSSPSSGTTQTPPTVSFVASLATVYRLYNPLSFSFSFFHFSFINFRQNTYHPIFFLSPF